MHMRHWQKVDHIPDDLANFNTSQRTEITQGIFSEYNAIKLETGNQKITRKFKQVWKLWNTLPKNPWVKKYCNG